MTWFTLNRWRAGWTGKPKGGRINLHWRGTAQLPVFIAKGAEGR